MDIAFDELMEHGAVAEAPGIPRTVYVRQDLFLKFNDRQFRKRFRMHKQRARQLIHLLFVYLEPKRYTNNALSAEQKVLIFLRFAATSAFQLLIGDVVECSQATISRVVSAVADALNHLFGEYVKFPRIQSDFNDVEQQFRDMRGFPNVISAIDCTHIKISNPGTDNAGRFFNRKQFYSINTQMTCTSTTLITSVVAHWQGSAHDARIFSECNLKQRFENDEFRHYVLLGDGGYKCTKYLMTPVLNPVTEEERRYNEAHKGSRVIIEQLFGRLKRRFPCLSGGLRTTLPTSQNIITGLAVLHNFLLLNGEPAYAYRRDIQHQESELVAYVGDEETGVANRAQFITRYFQ